MRALLLIIVIVLLNSLKGGRRKKRIVPKQGTQVRPKPDEPLFQNAVQRNSLDPVTTTYHEEDTGSYERNNDIKDWAQQNAIVPEDKIIQENEAAQAEDEFKTDETDFRYRLVDSFILSECLNNPKWKTLYKP